MSENVVEEGVHPHQALPSFRKLLVNKDAAGEVRGDETTLLLPYEKLVRLARSGRILGHIFRYREVLLKTRRLETLTKPFLTAIVIKLMSSRAAVIEDDQGRRFAVTWLFILARLRDYLHEYSQRRPFLENVHGEVRRFRQTTQRTAPPKLDLSGQPVYFRTDLTYGLLAGGSVGHIAGVLNNLSSVSGAPVFLTSAAIPTVDPTIETYPIDPEDRFLSFPELRYLDFNRTIEREARKRLRSRKISFIYQRYCLNNYAGLRIARHYKVPFVLEYNGSEIWVGKHWGKRIRYEDITNAIEELNLQCADLVVVVSKSLRKEILERGVDPRRIVINPNGVNTDTYSPHVDGTPIRDKYGLEGKTVIGFIGTFGRWHGAEVLADAFAELLHRKPGYRSNVTLLYIGDGMMMPEVRKRVSHHGIRKHVVFSGVVPQESGPVHLAACDILVSPHVPNPDETPFFGSPTKLFEYMAMGKGIVASRIGQIEEVLQHNDTAWMVKPADPVDLMEGLEALIENPELRTILGANARQKAVLQYTWINHTNNIVHALTKVADGG